MSSSELIEALHELEELILLNPAEPTTYEDAFGSRINVGSTVAFASTDGRNRPRINVGVVVAQELRKVKVYRVKSSGLGGVDETPRQVWVERSKVVKTVEIKVQV